MKNHSNKLLLNFLLLSVGAMALAIVLGSSNFVFFGRESEAEKRIWIGDDRREVQSEIIGLASWYGEKNEECLGCRRDRITACGETFNEEDYTFALPKGMAFVCGQRYKISHGDRSVEARANDTGGFGAKKYGRIADLSKATFAALAPLEVGVITVRIEVLASMQ